MENENEDEDENENAFESSQSSSRNYFTNENNITEFQFCERFNESTFEWQPRTIIINNNISSAEEDEQQHSDDDEDKDENEEDTTCENLLKLNYKLIKFDLDLNNFEIIDESAKISIRTKKCTYNQSLFISDSGDNMIKKFDFNLIKKNISIGLFAI